MAFVTERWSTPQLSRQPGGYRARRMFDVTGATDPVAAVDAVVAAFPDTAYNHTHPLSSWLYVDGQNPSQPSLNVITVEITYASNPAGRHIDPGNPLLEPPRYKFEWGNISEGCDRDTFGNVIQNTANQSFASLTPTDVLVGWLIVEQNEPFYDVARAVAFSNAVNSLPVAFGRGAYRLDQGQSCCRRIIPVTPITAQAVYCTVQYSIELRGGYRKDEDGYWDGFKARIENSGTRGYWSNSGTITPGPIIEVVDGQVQPVGFPVRLDDKGKPILLGSILGGTVSLGGYLIGTAGTSPGYAVAVNSPKALPSTTIIEKADDAYFIKQFPQTLKLKDLNDLGL